jgi:hypothetical protein
MLVGSDLLTEKDYEAVNKVTGDLFMLAGATLYGLGQCSFLGLFETPSVDTRVISKCR